MSGRLPSDAYQQASGGWGSLKAVTQILVKEQAVIEGSKALSRQNKVDGFMCVSCAWAKPAHPRPFEFCESGVKATAWDLTGFRADAALFAQHTVTELESWHDHDLEQAGRLTQPMRWDAATDRYRPVAWEQAFAEIGRELKALAPDQAVFYTSGRASLETSYMYQLFARLYGTNNLPDSSNMCHESSAVGLTAAIGVGVGTITLDDFDHTDMMFFFGHNVGTNSPRMLHLLQDARKRGVPIVTFNPLREPGLVSFVNPQSPLEMLTPGSTDISTDYHQLRNGGDTAAIAGISKALFELDDDAIAQGLPSLLDREFITTHTSGFDDYARWVRQTSWPQIERASGLARAALHKTAREYANANAVIANYGMGLTQHREGVQNVRMIINLLLLRGNIGKPGAGPLPIRGHSNVQGQRTVGITEKPELAPLDRLAEQFAFEPPRHEGLATVDACQGIIDGSVRAVVQLGGNLVRSVPDRHRIEPAWRRLRLTVGIATHLNRSHLLHGEIAYLLPCLSRIEIDEGPAGPRAVSMEDSTGCMHGSRGVATPASDALRSEPDIVASLALATVAGKGNVDWQAWAADYAVVRDAIATTYPDIFHDFNARLFTPGGFHRPLPARERVWKTESGKAEFYTPVSLDANPDMPAAPDSLSLFTIRSDDQFNTTIYGHSDRFRGISDSRMVLFINASDAEQRRLAEGDIVDIASMAPDGVRRVVSSLRLVFYDIPRGCVAGYYPECNPVIPLSHYAKQSKVPAAKGIPVSVQGVEGWRQASLIDSPQGAADSRS